MNSVPVIKAALLGAGTVGGGVCQILEWQKEEMPQKLGVSIELKKILVRDTAKKREGIDSALLTDSWQEILEDPEIQIVVEVMGGIEPAKTYILEALRAGKNVVTANKDLLAEYGREILDTAEEYGRDLMFEAAVAGGIPIIRPLKQCLAANHITEVMGIVNGTTNYILTRMTADHMEFSEALALAAELGYAEADPTADIEGFDAARKVAILASIAFNSRVTFQDVATEGITKITAADIKYAVAMGTSIKLLATSRKMEEGFYAMVSPVMISKKSPLYSVNGVFNAIFIHGNVLGDAMFYGSGAGKLPTASAVVGDVVDCAKHQGKTVVTYWRSKVLDQVDIKDVEHRFFVRVKGNLQEDKEKIEVLFGKAEFIGVPGLEGEFGFVTELMSERTFDEKAAALPEILGRIRIRA